ncbi:MAG: HNH endonuclease [Deltaproteobacteria bacterium]|nr:HNH endonuclease [Deltaproteobacteria bacterium]
MDTLVLDPGYQPVARVPWMRAVALLFMGKVEVVESYDSWTVRSVTVELQVPAVVRFLRGVRGVKRAVRFSRENVYARDSGRCQYCGQRVPRPEATYDHVLPRSQGGHTRWENIVIACLPCNQKKGGRTPQQASMKLRTVPAKPKALPEAVRFTYTPGMPAQWRSWLRDFSYWNGELDES